MSTVSPPSCGGRRQIDLKCWDERTVVGWLEDDQHHFGVTVHHDGNAITDIHLSAPRTPWATCAGAEVPLKALIGKPLIARASDIGKLIEMRLQCTHAFDLTGLTLAHAANRRGHRRYHVIASKREVLQRPGDVRTSAEFGPGDVELLQNGERVLHWKIDRDRIIAPVELAGQSLGQGFREWTETLDVEQAERAHVVRRALLIMGARSVDLDSFDNADAMAQPALCHTFAPEQRHRAWRHFGATQNYEDTPERMLRFVDRQA